VLPASGVLRRLSAHDRLPINAIVLAGVVAALLLITTQSEDIYFTLISFTVGGFYIAFAFPLFASVMARRGGRFATGPWNLGAKAAPIALIASLWALFEFVNIAWPRATDLPWYQEYGVLLMVVVIGVLGLVVYASVRENVVIADRRLKARMAAGEDDVEELP
jgi:amino acid transporter